VVSRVNARFGPKEEPIKAATFREYTGILGSDWVELTAWLNDRILSVTGKKITDQLKYLKVRRSIIYNVCHPKARDTYVHPEMRMSHPFSNLTTTSLLDHD
jgi:hypothetical protein